VKQTVQDTVS